MKKQMTVNEFVKQFTSCQTEAAKTAALKGIIKTHYVPYDQKVFLARMCVEVSNVDTKTKLVRLNTPATYLTYTTTILSMYTNLKLEKDKSSETYDALMKANALQPLLDCIGSDLDEFQSVLKMCADDFRENETSTRSAVEKLIAFMTTMLDTSVQGLAEAMNSKEEKNEDAETSTQK